MGAFLDLSVRRSQIAATDIFKGACRKPKRCDSHFICFATFNAYVSITTAPNKKSSNSLSVKPPKIKNITKTVLGETIGRLHMKKQNFDRVGGRKVAALRTKRVITEDPDSGSNKGGKRRKIG